MKKPADELDDLRAQVRAQKMMMNALLIGLLHKNVLTRSDIETLIESTLVAVDHLFDDRALAEAVSGYVEDFRLGCLGGEEG